MPLHEDCQIRLDRYATDQNGFPLHPLLLSPGFLAIFAPAVAKVYIVSFRIHDERRTKSRKFLLCELPTELSAYGVP
jgi:hypothetical protein